MTNDDLPKMPSLDDILKGLEEKYDPNKTQESGQEKDDLLKELRGQLRESKELYRQLRERDSTPLRQSPVAFNQPMTLICSIKSERSQTGNGEIQVIPCEVVICPHFRPNYGPNSCSLLGTIFITRECPFYQSYVKGK